MKLSNYAKYNFGQIIQLSQLIQIQLNYTIQSLQLRKQFDFVYIYIYSHTHEASTLVIVQ